MEMVHGLPTPRPDVRGDPVTLLRDPFGSRQIRGNGKDPAEERARRIVEVDSRRNVRPG